MEANQAPSFSELMNIVPPLARQKLRFSRKGGMVLVIMLAMIVLVTIAVMAFFAHSTTNRQIETRVAKRTEAALLAQTASDYIIGLLMKEITDSTSSTSSNGFYLPKINERIIPERIINPTIALSDTNFLNLVRQSTHNANVFGDTNASSDNTSISSRNGREVNATRWNMPFLLNGNGFTASNQLPNWVYVTKTGGITSTPSSDVVGRFAYNVYDIGGLLNANIAGYDSSVINSTSTSKLKHSIAGANLTQLPGLSGKQQEIAQLVTFRNNGSTGTEENFFARINASAESGFLSSLVTNKTNASEVFTNNYFTSRQDLLRYARTQNASFTNALPYLTHFSRAVMAPSWKSPTETARNPNLPTVTFTAAASIAHYTDNGSLEPYFIQAGDSVLQRKFSLAKLAWLTPTGPASSDLVPAIRYCFGLEWDDSNERWNYVEDLGSNNNLLTLAEIAPKSREPNFFELLNSGIAEGSLGFNFVSAPSLWDDYSAYIGSTETKAILESRDLQIMRIGANIIDSADSDNYPTIVSFPISSYNIEQAGVEDLPYLYSLLMQGLCDIERAQKAIPATPGNPGRPAIPGKIFAEDIVWVPLFINPHRASSTPLTSQPDSVRMEFASGTLNKAAFNGGGALFAQPLTRLFTDIVAEQGTIDIPSSLFESFRARPKAMRGAIGDENRLDSLVSYIHPLTAEPMSNIDTAYGDVQGFRVFSWQKDYGGIGWIGQYPMRYLTFSYDWHENGYAPYTYFNDLNIVMRYKTPSGRNWKTYHTLGGNENLPGSGMNGAKQDGVPRPGQVLRSGRHYNDDILPCHDLNKAYHIISYDPRTSRGGPKVVRAWSFEEMPRLTNFVVRSGDTGAPHGVYPEAAANATTYPSSYIGSDPVPTNYPDNDSQFRPADAFLNPSQANPYRKLSGSNLSVTDPSRPMVLQRPFRTVGELGYVFRDQTWKTLSLFDQTSADSALLDLFSVSDQPDVTAGLVNLNTRHKPVLQALFSESAREPDGGDAVSTTLANKIASGLISFSYQSNGTANSNISVGLPAITRAMSSTNLTSSTAYPISTDAIKYRRELIPRALSDTTQTRTWNILADIIAQIGRFPTTSTAADSFIVESESRTWVSSAIDRYTSKLVEQQTEQVNE